MSRYRFAVEYSGSRYAGWQVQPGQPTVEAELENALGVCLRTPINIVGAGRTDAGVHALGQVAHFDYAAGDPSKPGDPGAGLDVYKVERSVNALTPDDVHIRRLEPCAPEFHARYDALSRRYVYRIALRPTALYAGLSWHPGPALDAALLRRELADVEGSHDFAPFSVPRDDGKSTLCKVIGTEMRSSEQFLEIRIEADRFLHKMVRAIVGACVETARGARAPGLVRSILEGTFSGEWTWAPPRGLCLEKVVYRDYEF